MSRYRFGPFELDEAEHSLHAEGRPVPLTGRAFDTLLVLVHHPGRLVTRDELIGAVWGETIVEEGNLHWTISAVRRALAADCADPIIETVRGLGYRFLPPVEVVPSEAPGGAVLAAPPPASLAAGDSLPSHRMRWRLALTALLPVLLLGAVAWTVASRLERLKAAETAGVAVVGFRNLSPGGDAGWVGTALSEMLAADLGSGGTLRLFPSDDVAGMRRDLGLQLDAPMGLADLAQIRRRLGSEWVIVGSYLVIPGQDPPLRVDALLRHTGTGETRTAVSRRGRETDLFTLTDSLAGELRRSLGASTRSEQQPARGAMPAAPEVQRLYAEGLERLQRRDAVAAARRLADATAADPEFSGAWLALAQADELLGFQVKAADAALKATERSGRLPERQRLAIEATYLRIARRWPDAVDRLRRLYALSRHALEDGLALGEALIPAGQPKETLATVVELRKEHPAASDDARLSLLEARAFGRLEDFPHATAAAQRTVTAARRQGMVQVEVEALHRMAAARLRAGTIADCGRSLAEVTTARSKAEPTGDRFLLGGVLQDFSVVLDTCGQPARADQMAREAIDLYREIGAVGKLPPLLYNLGTSRLEEGDLLAADSLMREALDACLATSTLCRERLLHPIGVNRLHRGELAESRRMIEEGIQLNSQLGNRTRVAEAQGFLPDLAFWSGDTAQAVALQRQVLALRQEIGVAHLIAWAHSDLSGWLTEAGRGAEALEHARLAVTMAAKDGETTLNACSRASLAFADLAVRDLEAADRESAAAIALLRPPRFPFCSFFVWSVRAQVLLARGQLEAAEALIDQGLDLARRGGFVTFELWGRLLRAELAQARGRSAEASRLGNELAGEAQAKGFGIIAQRCKSLVAHPAPSHRSRGKL